MKKLITSISWQQIDIVCLETKKIITKLKADSKALGKRLFYEFSNALTDNFQFLPGMCMCLKNGTKERPVLLAGYESGDVILWDLGSSKMISKLKAHNEPGRFPP